MVAVRNREFEIPRGTGARLRLIVAVLMIILGLAGFLANLTAKGRMNSAVEDYITPVQVDIADSMVESADMVDENALDVQSTVHSELDNWQTVADDVSVGIENAEGTLEDTDTTMVSVSAILDNEVLDALDTGDKFISDTSASIEDVRIYTNDSDQMVAEFDVRSSDILDSIEMVRDTTVENEGVVLLTPYDIRQIADEIDKQILQVDQPVGFDTALLRDVADVAESENYELLFTERVEFDTGDLRETADMLDARVDVEWLPELLRQIASEADIQGLDKFDFSIVAVLDDSDDGVTSLKSIVVDDFDSRVDMVTSGLDSVDTTLSDASALLGDTREEVVSISGEFQIARGNLGTTKEDLTTIREDYDTARASTFAETRTVVDNGVGDVQVVTADLRTQAETVRTFDVSGMAWDSVAPVFWFFGVVLLSIMLFGLWLAFKSLEVDDSSLKNAG